MRKRTHGACDPGFSHLARVDAIEARLTSQRADLLTEWDGHETVMLQRRLRVEDKLRVLYDVAAARECLPPPPVFDEAFSEGTYSDDGLAGDFYDDVLKCSHCCAQV